MLGSVGKNSQLPTKRNKVTSQETHLRPFLIWRRDVAEHGAKTEIASAWVREHLSPTCLGLPALGRANKPLFMHRASDVLVDDLSANCAAWSAAGGVAVKHSGDWGVTCDGLVAAGVL